MYAALKNGLLTWIFQWRGPERGTITLVQRRVFILPTRQGLLFAVVIMLMLIGSVNYDLSLGFILAFLLGATGIQSMLHTFRNLVHLRIAPGRVHPVFASEDAEFQIIVTNTTRADRYSIGLTRDGQTADYIDVPAADATIATVTVRTTQRGWLRLDRMTLFTRFPTGLFRAWSYADLDVRCLVYPAPAASPLPLPAPASGAGDAGRHGPGYDEFSGLRPYRPGDSLRHIAWKAAARDHTLLTKQFAGHADAELWLAWDALPQGLATEQRLSHLVRWVLDADRAGVAFGLRIPGCTLPIAGGAAQRVACLSALALYGTTTTKHR